MASSNDEAFVHLSSNIKFKERNDAIFGGLSGLEEKYEKEVPKDDPFSEAYPKKQKPRRPKKVPDHVLHPEKWTKYSLEEDGTSAIASGKTGDALNQEIATNFLNELRDRRAREEEKGKNEKMDISMKEQMDSGLKRKRDQVNEDEKRALMEEQANESASNVINSGTTVIMKTYEFGQKQKRKSSMNSNVTEGEWSETELNLSHLNDSLIDTEEGSRDIGKVTETQTKFNTMRKKKNLRKSELTDDD